MIFSLAHPYGTPTILSSYQFSSYDDGAPNGGKNPFPTSNPPLTFGRFLGAGTCSGNNGTDGWLCQHRWTPVSGMAGFRNNVGDAPLTDWVSPQTQQIAFGRGDAGYVAINNADEDWSGTFDTSLADGGYCDVVSGGSVGGNCTGVG